MLRISMPRRHPPIIDDFNHCLAPTDHFVVTRQRERSDFTFTMTLDAMSVEDAGNLIGEGNIAVWIRYSLSTDEAANDFC